VRPFEPQTKLPRMAVGINRNQFLKKLAAKELAWMGNP